MEERLLEAAAAFPPPPGIKFSYGTAGFRLDASLLHSTVFRVGILAALRSIATAKVTGVVITASHNHILDNGVKIVDPSGEMLAQTWECYADALANAPDSNSLFKVLNTVIEKESINRNGVGRVLLARDTRPSGQALMTTATKGIEAMDGLPIDMGVLTTPQLHWIVREMNLGHPCSEADYFLRLTDAFKSLLNLKPKNAVKYQERRILVDGANGVGAKKLEHLQTLIQGLVLEVRNSGEGQLNECVGADYVQKEKIAPRGFSASDVGKNCASIDGDADRLVYFYLSQDKQLHLLDGDKMLSLFSCFLQQQLEELQENGSIPGYGTLEFGVVQTAYANGASTCYLKETLGLQVVRTPTGVKYLHEEAKKFDVGLYFEANGHGTILFSEKFLSFCKTEASGKGSAAINRFLEISIMVNRAIGDALSGLLMVEAILSYWNWSLEDWNQIYSDFPSKQLKVKVMDRLAITTTDAETKVAKPKEVQDAIDIEIGKHQDARAFVRPSGTEDVVRVYAEAATQQAADELASAVATLVHRLAGGIS